MSLKKFHIFFVFFSLLAMLLLYLYISHLLQVNIDKNVKNSINSTALELRQQLRNDFGTLQQRFANYENVSLEKLYEATNYLGENAKQNDLRVIAKEINANVYDGRYEIRIINDLKIVEKSTALNDVGFDYKVFPHFSKELDQLKSGGIEYKTTSPMFDEYSQSISQYYVTRGLGDQWIMLGFVLPFDEYVNQNVNKLQAVFPSLQGLDLYILTYDAIQHINTKKEPRLAVDLLKTNQQHIEMMMTDLSLTTTAERSVIVSIAERFSQQNTLMFEDTLSRQTLVYSLATSSTENDADDFMLITKMHFDQNYFLTDYLELKNLMYLFITMVIIFMVAGFFLIHKAIIQKFGDIVIQIQKDDPIKIEGYLFSELKFFVQRYNNFLLRWKEEVKRLNDITLIDELTQCANRRYFNNKIKKQIDLYERYKQEFSMIMFDIDNFKHVNDIYGHSVGDHVLKTMAADVQKQIRTSDVLCRIGGEEFAVILPETNRESAMFVAEKIRAYIAKQLYIEKEQVTISLGVDSYNEGSDFNTFYTTVDSYLYKSKNSGKNCVNSS